MSCTPISGSPPGRAWRRAGTVHAVTLHGTDLAHPRSRLITAAALPRLDLVATVSQALADRVPGRAVRGARAVLPCGVDSSASRRARAARPARSSASIPTPRACCSRPIQTGPRSALIERRRWPATVPLHSLGNVEPEQVPLWVNAANAVLVPSDREGFGLAVVEALACNVPVLATPVGIHAEALAGIRHACEPFDAQRWRTAVAPHLAADDPRVRPGGGAALQRRPHGRAGLRGVARPRLTGASPTRRAGSGCGCARARGSARAWARRRAAPRGRAAPPGVRKHDASPVRGRDSCLPR